MTLERCQAADAGSTVFRHRSTAPLPHPSYSRRERIKQIPALMLRKTCLLSDRLLDVGSCIQPEAVWLGTSQDIMRQSGVHADNEMSMAGVSSRPQSPSELVVPVVLRTALCKCLATVR
jgi:hypothetical protein